MAVKGRTVLLYLFDVINLMLYQTSRCLCGTQGRPYLETIEKRVEIEFKNTNPKEENRFGRLTQHNFKAFS